MRMENCEDSSHDKTVGFFHMKETEVPEDYMPSENEPYMNPRQLAYFRRKLLSWREELVSQLGVNLHQMREESAKEVDFLDQSTREADTALKICSQDRALKIIEEIDAALDRIDSKTYGYCEETGEEIGIRRLEARPTATLSLEAQHWLERGKYPERKVFSSDNHPQGIPPAHPSL
jgi:DnaK suppressor protein